ncbi:hypothetical protein GGF32_000339 [Allomyces javanicus]|nr:hypothetical protein GGF32_000339 [Allomyces javanicus]
MPMPPTSTRQGQLAAHFLTALMGLHSILPTNAAPSDVALKRDLPTHATQSSVDFGRKGKVPTPAGNSFTILPPFGTAVGPSAPMATAVVTWQPAADSYDTTRTIATAYLTETLGFPTSEWVIKNVVTTSSGVTAVYARQNVNGLEVVNADVTINIK